MGMGGFAPVPTQVLHRFSQSLSVLSTIAVSITHGKRESSTHTVDTTVSSDTEAVGDSVPDVCPGVTCS